MFNAKKKDIFSTKFAPLAPGADQLKVATGNAGEGVKDGMKARMIKFSWKLCLYKYISKTRQNLLSTEAIALT